MKQDVGKLLEVVGEHCTDCISSKRSFRLVYSCSGSGSTKLLCRSENKGFRNKFRKDFQIVQAKVCWNRRQKITFKKLTVQKAELWSLDLCKNLHGISSGDEARRFSG